MKYIEVISLGLWFSTTNDFPSREHLAMSRDIFVCQK